MKNSTEMGSNRTGIDTSPIDSKKTIAEANLVPPSSPGTVQDLLEERADFIRAAGEPVGTVPPPGTLRGMAAIGVQKLALRSPEVLIDKLGERLAFERTGVRLYEALIGKCETELDARPGFPIDRLREFREAEHRHFELIRSTMVAMGADPTALTPCADSAGVESLGLLQVLTDPRTSVAQSVHAILVAELADHDGWQSLILIAETLNHPKLTEAFRGALAEEKTHLVLIRNLYNQLVQEDARTA